MVRQLLENVESIGDFRVQNYLGICNLKKCRWNADELREKLLEGFHDETEFSYMKDMNRGKNLLVNRKSEGLNLHFPRYISDDPSIVPPHTMPSSPGKIIGHIDGEKHIFFVREL